MGRYLDILERADRYDINDINDKTPTKARTHRAVHNQKDTFGRISRLCRTLSALEARCPELMEVDDWQQAVVDARSFIARWGKQAEKLGWTARDLFGLFPVPPKRIRLFGDSHDTTQLDSSGCCAADPLLL